MTIFDFRRGRFLGLVLGGPVRVHTRAATARYVRAVADASCPLAAPAAMEGRDS